MSYYKEVILASLLHDIGKFYQKSSNVGLDTSGKHPVISGRFIRKHAMLFEHYADVDILEELVRRHHDNKQAFEKELLADEAPMAIRPYAQMISLADNLSSGERDEKSDNYTNYRTRPLNSVFARLFNKEDSITQYAYPAKALSVNNIFPQILEENNETDRSNLIQGFNYQMQQLEKDPPKDFNQFIVILDTLLQQYLWAIPSSSYDKIADVSLYDHLKTTAAIASALYQYHEAVGKIEKKDIQRKQENKFLLLQGTFSGIQKYIFAAATSNATGVAKRLRARSFYVDALISAIAQLFIDRFTLSRENILMLTGGKFCLLLPNYPGAAKKIEAITEALEQELFSRFHSDIKICITYKEMNAEDFQHYSDIVKELSEKLSEKKNHPFSSVLCPNGKWNEEAFLLYDNLSDQTLCKTCRERLIDKDKEECHECRKQKILGEKLMNSSYICYRYGKPLNNQPSWRLIDNYYMELTTELTDATDIYLTHQINKETISENFSFPIQSKYLANNQAKDDSGVLTFNDIAEKATGRKALGALKADVDILGFLFADGLKTEQRHYGTISRVSTMSHMLDMFFSGYVNHLIAEKYPTVYSVFSGGDDLFLIAPWSNLPKLALILQKEFGKATASNPNVTMSAALCTFPAKTHVALMAEESEHILKQVKSVGNPTLYPKHKGRNAVYFMGDILEWKDLIYIFDLTTKILHPAMETTGINLMRRIAQYSASYREFLRDKDIMKLMFEPLLTYDRKRNYKESWAKEKETEKFCDYVELLAKEAANCANYKRGTKKNLYLAQTAVKYCMDLTKEERNGEL